MIKMLLYGQAIIAASKFIFVATNDCKHMMKAITLTHPYYFNSLESGCAWGWGNIKVVAENVELVEKLRFLKVLILLRPKMLFHSYPNICFSIYLNDLVSVP